MKACILVMGICGTGKTTIASRLATHLNLPFIEADEFHPPENIQKMTAGIPLDDEDRIIWLDRLSQELQLSEANGFVLACSALKKKYRKQLAKGLMHKMLVFHLQGSKHIITDRMKARNHFMPATLIDSQLEILELSPDLISIDINQSVENILEQIRFQIDLK
ncbi:MAG: gluconokinase [Saprospiraceae bacterium]|nr:gluconokinase [Saprospiraceae bacterium]